VYTPPHRNLLGYSTDRQFRGTADSRYRSRRAGAQQQLSTHAQTRWPPAPVREAVWDWAALPQRFP